MKCKGAGTATIDIGRPFAVDSYVKGRDVLTSKGIVEPYDIGDITIRRVSVLEHNFPFRTSRRIIEIAR